MCSHVTCDVQSLHGVCMYMYVACKIHVGTGLTVLMGKLFNACGTDTQCSQKKQRVVPGI